VPALEELKIDTRTPNSTRDSQNYKMIRMIYKIRPGESTQLK